MKQSWLAGAAIMMLYIGGCAQGDFGRPHRSLIGDRPHDWIGAEAVGSVGLPASHYPLTDDERQMRDLAYPLIAPPYARHRWIGILAERGILRDGPEHGIIVDSKYYERLTGAAHRSPASRYARLIEDGRNDVVRLDLFFATVLRVSDMDSRRQKSLGYVVNLTAGEEANAVNRINENALIVDWVCRSIGSRIVAYRYALERLVIAVPSRSAVDAERAVGLLQSRQTRYCEPPGAAAVIAKG